MITLYSGTQGSGKSLQASRKIRDQLAMHKKDVIANYPINMDEVTNKGKKKKIGRFTYLRNDQLTVEFLVKYAKKYHKVGKESQTMVVIDEAGMMFNSREYASSDRMTWIQFFMIHRHYGYDFILIAQHDRLIDRQIRAFLEYNVKHRKVNNYQLIGLMLTLFRIHTFAAITYVYGIREASDRKMFRYRKKDAKLYDTTAMFKENFFDYAEQSELAAADGGSDAGAGGHIGGGKFRIVNNYKKSILHSISHSYVKNKGGYALIGQELLT